MIKVRKAGWLCAGLLCGSMADAQTLVADPDLPIAFMNTVPDVCFPVAHGRKVVRENAATLLLVPVEGRPAAIQQRYGQVPQWYRSVSKPNNIFVGVGDRENRCHIVLADTKDAKIAYRRLYSLLLATGFGEHRYPNGEATTLFVKRGPRRNTLVLLRGLTDADDGRGPQVSVDVSSASENELHALLP